MKKHIWLPVIAVIMVWVLLGLGISAAGVFSKTLNGKVNIVADVDFAFFSDPAAVVPVTSVNLPDVEPGEESKFTVYVKNTSKGREILSSGPGAIPDDIGTLKLTFDGKPQVTLEPGAISKVVGVLDVDEDAETGPLDFTFAIIAVPDTAAAATPPSTSSAPTATTTLPSPTATATVSLVSYAAKIQPIFNQYCVSCHGTKDGGTFDSYASTIASTSNGTPVIIPGNAQGSILYQSVSGGSMRSYLGGSAATSSQAIRDWIDQGANNN